MLSASEETLLRQVLREYQRYGFRVGVTNWPLTHSESGKGGQIIGIDPRAFDTLSTTPRKYLLGVPCLIQQEEDGWPVGLAGVEVQGDGSSAECVEKGFCGGDCTSSEVPPTPADCVTVSGTVTLQPEDLGANTANLAIVGYGGLYTDTAGSYSVGLSFAGGASVGFTCCVPLSEAPRDVYYSLDGGTTWLLAADIGETCDGFLLDLPADCDNTVEVLWELWEAGSGPGALAGTVADSGGTPLSGRLVTLSGGTTATATSDGSGGYSFGDLPLATLTATVGISGGESATHNLDGAGYTSGAGVTFDVTGTHDLDFKVTLSPPPPTTGDILVTVLRAGGAADPGRVLTYSGGGTGTTDGAGQYTFGSLSPTTGANVVLTPFGKGTPTYAIDNPVGSGSGFTASPITVTAGVTTNVTFQG